MKSILSFSIVLKGSTFDHFRTSPSPDSKRPTFIGTSSVTEFICQSSSFTSVNRTPEMKTPASSRSGGLSTKSNLVGTYRFEVTKVINILGKQHSILGRF